MKIDIKKIIIPVLAILYFTTAYSIGLDFWLSVVFSVMTGGSIYLLVILINCFVFGSKQKAIIKEYIHGYAHLDRRNRNSYIITVLNSKGKPINKRISYRTSITLKEGDTVEVFLNKEGDVFIAKDLYFLIPFAIALLIAPFIVLIVVIKR